MTRSAKLALIAASALAASLAVPYSALANDAHHVAAATGSAAEKPAASSNGSGSAMSEGEIRKVDKSAGKITIKHGPIENLGMPNMTMVFRAKDPAMLEQVKAGDKVKFAADKVNGVYTVTQIETAK